MPPARDILSDALALWIQLHTKYIHTAGNDGLPLLVLLFWFVPFWIQMETHWPLWWYLRAWYTLLSDVQCPWDLERRICPLGPVAVILVRCWLLSMCSSLLVFIFYTDDGSYVLDICSCLMSSLREIWGIRTRDQIFTQTLKGALEEDCKKLIFFVYLTKIFREKNYLHRCLSKAHLVRIAIWRTFEDIFVGHVDV